ncbi:MAG: DNA repair protein RadC [Oscillospiraceae bacterium]|nr:DNA repair protein RadC [Oscillospiraceae bacterium]
MGIHDGHRGRMKHRFLTDGLDGFHDHEILELLLFYAIPRRDTNPIAHELLTRFGSLSGVLDAAAEELCRVDGVSENAAVLLKLIPHAAKRYSLSRSSFNGLLDSTEKVGDYLVPRFFGERDEVVYMVCMDSKFKVLNTKLIFRGNVNSASISIRKIVETALTYNATRVILSHNHTSGIAVPSREDIDTTFKLKNALAAVDVQLVDHIVVADDDYVSMADSGIL